MDVFLINSPLERSTALAGRCVLLFFIHAAHIHAFTWQAYPAVPQAAYPSVLWTQIRLFHKAHIRVFAY
jgi:hypothetical protein